MDYQFDCGDFDIKDGEIDIIIDRDLGEEFISIHRARLYFENNIMIDVTEWVKLHTQSAMYTDILDKASDKYKNVYYEKD